MARATTTHTWAGAGVAFYKAAVVPLSDMLNSVHTRTNDTGQVVWTAVAAPPAASTVRDYEVFQFSDGLQATAPIFIRVDYMYSTSSPLMRITVGTSTDGAGNLGGAVAGPFSIYSFTTGASGTLSGYTADLDGSMFMFVHGLNPAVTAVDQWGGVVVERIRNLDGTPSGDGFMVYRWDTSGTGASAAGVFSGQYSRTFDGAAQPGPENTPTVLLPALNTTSSMFSGNTSYAFPYYGYTGPRLRGASQAVLLGYATDFPRCSEISLTHYGAPAKFLALGTAANSYLPIWTANQPTTPLVKQGLSPLFRWE